MDFISNEETEKLFEDYVESETTGARKLVEDVAAAVQQEQKDMKHTEMAGLTNIEPGKTFKEMMVAIGGSLSDHASSDDGADGEYEDDEETEQGKLSKDDEPGWVMGTITKTVQQRMERFRQMQMMLDDLTQLASEDGADFFHERDVTYGKSELIVLAIIQQ